MLSCISRTIVAQGIIDLQECRPPRLIQGSRDQEAPDETAINKDIKGGRNRTGVDFNPLWFRIIYREIDLEKEPNQTLYYPLFRLPGQKIFFPYCCLSSPPNRWWCMTILTGMRFSRKNTSFRQKTSLAVWKWNSNHIR